MLSATLGKPQLSTRQVRRKPKVVTKRLLRVNSAAGAASEIVAPAAFRPIGRSATVATGNSFPVFFWTGAGGDGAMRKIRTGKLPAIAVTAFPRGREAFPDSPERSHYASLSFLSIEPRGSVGRRGRASCSCRRYDGGTPIGS